VKHKVVTPENLELTFELAGLTSRFLAWLVDTLFMIAIIIGAYIVLAIIGFVSRYLFATLMMVIVFCVQQGYFIFFELKTGGTTPGKRIMKIRVIQDAGIRIGFYHSFLRNILRIMDSTPLMILHILGAGVAFFHPLNRRLGDAVAGTVVVRERSYPEPGKIITETDKYSTLLGNYQLRERIKRSVTTEEKEAMIEACLRAEEIELSRRLEIFARLGARMRSKLDLPPMEFSSDEKLVRNITAILLGAEPETTEKA
jgi:uncharacterized RDD family membrane protein YckC